MTDIQTDAFEIRAAAHAKAPAVLRPAQVWREGVTDEGVAAVLLALERGVVFYRNAVGRWLFPLGAPVPRASMGRDLSTVINEMIRTGLVRHYVHKHGIVTSDYLIPAPVHYRGLDGQSSCLFTGENLGAMRSRLVDDLTLVDCLACEQAIARGYPGGL
jgi:hypothetical protein